MSIRFNSIEANKVKEPTIYQNFSYINEHGELENNLTRLGSDVTKVEGDFNDIVAKLNHLSSLFGSYTKYDGIINSAKSKVKSANNEAYSELNNLINNIKVQLQVLTTQDLQQLSVINDLTEGLKEVRGDINGN